MTDRLRQILESKRARRRQFAARPFSEKLILLEKLRDRGVLIAASSVRQGAKEGK